MDRFEILKYSILLEEDIKTRIINHIALDNISNSFTSPEFFDGWSLPVKCKLCKFGKAGGGVKEIIFHSSARDLIVLFKGMKYEIKLSIMSESIFSGMVTDVRKFSTVLTGNKLVRDLCAHPTLNLIDALSKLTVFTFLCNNYSQITKIYYFYEHVKNNI